MSDKSQHKPARDICAYDKCSCPANDVVRDGKSYCSEGCAENNGCGHPGCDCRDKTV